MPAFRVTRHFVLPPCAGPLGGWAASKGGERVSEVVGYVDADDARGALREARKRYGSVREIGTLRATEVVGDIADDESFTYTGRE